MNIKGIQGYTGADIRGMVEQGGKFVIYKYCISIVFMTFNNPTDIYFIQPGKSRVTPALGFLVVNLLLGWWGIPWGPIYTIGNIGRILSGGKDVTAEVMAQINQSDPTYGTGGYSIPGTEAQPAYGQPAEDAQPSYNIPR
jgi:hypothetical protein